MTAGRLLRTGEVLDLVRRGLATTTSQLAAQMGLSRSTVAERVDLLVEHGLLVAETDVSPRRGRPPSLLSFNADAGVILAAQLGMSGARVAVTDLRGGVRWNELLEVRIQEGPERVLRRLERAFRRALSRLGEREDRIYGVGLGVPGLVELAGADREAPQSAGWINDPIADRLSASFGAPAYVDHDVNLLALGEQRTFWPDAEVLVCLKVGTVIGCGLVVDGRIVRGSRRLAGEIGHTSVPGAEDPCGCGNAGCLNVVAGGGAVARRLAALGFDTPNARDVARLARQDVAEASGAVREAGRHIGTVLAGVINLLNPDVVTVWGYLAEADVLFSGMRESIYRHAVPAAAATLELCPARLGDDAGIRGAALMVIEHVLAPDVVDQGLAAAYALAT